ncbi:phage terminase large subunit family protein [Pseudomonas sp. BCRC 81390]|uniref:terminase gpA endonuclease subunit n=1 Tax=Pseudomonas sp. BCRC 81390 TaxID=3054778 RepID=UPI00259A7C73|nr:terminase gpA endonuclease subunit [Pseudomonas sp. BCRC 81390]MDM3884668.1 phage terminase large subunit family protein [Pseudomonas sp. BCRC 81390]
MPPAAPIPGPFNPDANPYMRPVAWAFAQPCFSRVTFVMGTQMGKSVTMENVCGHRLDEDPTPIMYVAPTAPLLKSTVVPKFMDMIRGCESLLKKYHEATSSTFVKWIGAAKLRFAWAGSPTELAADSAGLILVDEVDRIVNTKEGDTLEIIEARGDAYVDSKVGYTATPLRGKIVKVLDERTGLWHWEIAKPEAVSSKIWRLWQTGTRHEWAVPCPHCGEYFVPWSDLIWWPGKGTAEECTPDEAEEHARLTCPNSGCMIEDKWRPWMNKRGIAVAPGESVKSVDGKPVRSGLADTEGFTHYSIWISGLCSFAAKKSYGFLAKKLLGAMRSGDAATLQGVYNTGFGECYSEVGDVPTWEAVKGERYGYPEGRVLLPPERIFCTVDVQKRGLYYVVRAWYPGMGSALLEHDYLAGDTDREEVWDALGDLLEREFDGYPITAMGIDIGYRDDEVYTFLHRYPSRVIAMRGRESLPMPFKKELVEQNKLGKTRKRGDSRLAFDATLSKRWVHSRIGVPDNRTGWWLLHQQVSNDYCRQIVGEEWSEEDGKFNKVGENHYLDCEGMQYILALREKLHRRKRGVLTKAQLKAAIKVAQGEPLEVDPESTAADAPAPVPEAAEREPVAPSAAPPKRRGRFKINRK